jgi:hypothetical protein
LPRAGRETIVASYAVGITIIDSEDRIVAGTDGYHCAGSEDELNVIAASCPR